MKSRSIRGRIATDALTKAMAVSASFLGIFFLLWILYEVAARGILALNLDFFTELPAPPGAGEGGVASAILGTAVITGLATLFGIPVGVAAGIYLAELGKDLKFSRAVRFTTNVLMGIPSIVIGLFVYAIFVLQVGHFSGIAGAISLALIMLPVVARTTEDMLNLVPDALRESALALGAPHWRVTLGITLRAAKKGVTTGVLLAVARVSGETAPLLFTALNSTYWPTSLNEPTSNLTVTIFNYAMSPYRDWQQMAWGGALLIMLAVLVINILSRVWLAEKTK